MSNHTECVECEDLDTCPLGNECPVNSRPFYVIYWHGHTHTATFWTNAVDAADAIAKTEAAFPGQVFNAEAFVA